MQLRVKYIFVEGAVSDLKDAWRDFEVRNGNEAVDQPHFIPAIGGCFVALLEDNLNLASWPGLRWRSSGQPAPAASSASPGTLQRFVRFLQSAGLRPVV